MSKKKYIARLTPPIDLGDCIRLVFDYRTGEFRTPEVWRSHERNSEYVFVFDGDGFSLELVKHDSIAYPIRSISMDRWEDFLRAAEMPTARFMAQVEPDRDGGCCDENDLEDFMRFIQRFWGMVELEPEEYY